jgi:hypothetical protein
MMLPSVINRVKPTPFTKYLCSMTELFPESETSKLVNSKEEENYFEAIH